MANNTGVGLSRSELKYEANWIMRQAPRDQDKMQDFLVDVLVSLIAKNNAAVASALEERDRVDLPEDG